MHHVVIIGCGFGGIEAAKGLGSVAGIRVTILDRCNHHLFQPLLYQVATAGLSAPAISAPIRHIFQRHDNITVLMHEVVAIEPAAKQVVVETGEKIGYDSLIIASGSTHSYFGHDEWAEHAPGLKTLADAMEIRRRVLYAFEAAELDPERADQWLSFVVIGGGPTGVEMAGTMAEIAHRTLKREFRRIAPERARIVLVEGADRILAMYPPKLSASALDQLRTLGVEVLLDAKVTGIDAFGIRIGERRLEARTVIWAAGVQASPLGGFLGVALDRAGRVPVAPDLTVPGCDGVYVVGDLAAASSDGKPVPGVSPAAKQMGRSAAANIRRRLAGLPATPFRYIDYGSMATIGRKRAIAKLHWLELRGLPAWLLWLFAHIYFLIGFRNRLMVFADWAFAYFTFARSARVIWDPVPAQAAAGALAAVPPAGAQPAEAQPGTATPGVATSAGATPKVSPSVRSPSAPVSAVPAPR
ncbi:MAG: NAD(P)/FAD-dependent oxidoreductase [Lautropia sp.]